jgi:hypothetical protein
MDQNIVKKETTRREFGKGALWVAPTLTVLLAASSQPAKATPTTSGGADCRYEDPS